MPLQQGLQRYLLPEELSKLAAVTVGIAGVGGLGGNVALMLVRSGIQRFLLLDHDQVDASNLNRQPYFPRHIGMPKVQALAEQILELCPQALVDIQKVFVDAQNLPQFLPKATLWVEAFDVPQSKRLLVEACLEHNLFCVSASGIAGYGGPPMQKRQLGENLVVVGDFSSDISQFPPLAPRVLQAAAMQADVLFAKALEASV